MGYLRHACLLCLVFGLTACSLFSYPVRETRLPVDGSSTTPWLRKSADIRSKPDGTQVSRGDPAKPNIEDYRDDTGASRFWLGLVEFDDQGWSYGSKSQFLPIQQRLLSELNDPAYRGQDFQLIVFIHGWHHNAADLDGNVQEFRYMLKRASECTEVAGLSCKRARRVIGIYVGWRGESLYWRGLDDTTVLDRKNTAEHVAKGEVRSVFAALRRIEQRANARTPQRVHSMVMGHSFGGLIAFHSLSQALLNDLTMDEPAGAALDALADPGVPAQAGAASMPAASAWPDLLVLINPAFEASRFEAFHRLAVREFVGAPWAEAPPRLVVVTADNDFWTGPAFTTERHLVSLFENYGPDDRGSGANTNCNFETGRAREERDANLHAIGFVKRYRSHRLCLDDANKPAETFAVFMPDPRDACEGAPETLDSSAPVWVVGAPSAVVNGHDGFLLGTSHQPLLLDWLLALQEASNPRLRVDLHRRILGTDSGCGAWP